MAVSQPFKRPHHQRIAKLLQAFDADFLRSAQCYFGGGTAIALLLDEYRESVDIDFLCSSREGFRMIREAVGQDLGRLLREPVAHARGVSSNQSKVLTFLEVDGGKVKVEIIREGNTELSGGMVEGLPVPVLSEVDLWSQKLMANADRGLDKTTWSRDIIDLGMMLQHWGPIPEEALQKAMSAYGRSIVRGFHQAMRAIADPAYLSECMLRMGMDLIQTERMLHAIDDASERLPLSEEERSVRRMRLQQIDLAVAAGDAKDPKDPVSLFYLLAKTAAPRAHFASAERAFIAKATCYGFAPEEIVQVIAEHSPAAACVDRMKAIEAHVLRRYDTLAHDCAEHVDPGDAPVLS